MDLGIIKIRKNATSDEIKEALKLLCKNEGDMNGNYGPDFLWSEAKGYNSNAEYLAHKVLEENGSDSIETLVNNFIDKWMDKSICYYHDWEVSFEETENYKIVAFATV